MQGLYNIKLPVFEGPLELLMTLIRDNKIDIYDIPIAFITNQYVEYLMLMRELNLDIAGEFLVMAATLIHIKTIMLLPAEERIKVYEEEDPRAVLVQRLIEYQSYREAAFFLKERQGEWADVFYKEPSLPPQETPLLKVEIYDLFKAFRDILNRVNVIHINKETLTIKDKIDIILTRLSLVKELSFEGLFQGPPTVPEIVTTFLALLEILRQGLAQAFQKEEFGPIWIMLAADAGQT